MAKETTKKKFKWGWSESVIAVSVIGVVAVAGTVYLGTVEKPAQEARDEKVACTNFNLALQDAYTKNNLTDFYYTLFRGAYKGIDETAEGKNLNERFVALAQYEVYVSKESEETMIDPISEATLAVQATCSEILGVTFSTPTSTPTPAPTN